MREVTDEERHTKGNPTKKKERRKESSKAKCWPISIATYARTIPPLP